MQGLKGAAAAASLKQGGLSGLKAMRQQAAQSAEMAKKKMEEAKKMAGEQYSEYNKPAAPKTPEELEAEKQAALAAAGPAPEALALLLAALTADSDAPVCGWCVQPGTEVASAAIAETLADSERIGGSASRGRRHYVYARAVVSAARLLQSLDSLEPVVEGTTRLFGAGVVPRNATLPDDQLEFVLRSRFLWFDLTTRN